MERRYKDGKVAIMIMTYKLRHTHMLEYATLFNKDYDVYIISQENDPAKEQVKQYETEKVKILFPNVTSIFQKRYWALEYAKEHKYKYLVLLDDDLLIDIYYLKAGVYTETGRSLKVLKGEGQLNFLIDLMHDKMKEYNGGLCGATNRAFIGFCPEKMLGKIYTTRMITNVVMMDVQKAENSDISYDPSGDVSEDMDINFKYLQEGYLCMSIPDYAWSEVDLADWGSGKLSTIYKSIKDIWHLLFGYFKKYHVSPRIKKNTGKLVFSVKGDKYFGTHKLPDIDPTILEYYNNEDLEGLKKFLSNNEEYYDDNNEEE